MITVLAYTDIICYMWLVGRLRNYCPNRHPEPHFLRHEKNSKLFHSMLKFLVITRVLSSRGELASWLGSRFLMLSSRGELASWLGPGSLCCRPAASLRVRGIQALDVFTVYCNNNYNVNMTKLSIN